MTELTLKQIFEKLSGTVSWGGIDLVSLDQLSIFGDTPLHTVCGWGDLEAATLMAELGADVNARGEYDETPLYATVRGDNPAVVKLLLKWEADKTLRMSWGGSVVETAAMMRKDPAIIAMLSSDHSVRKVRRVSKT